MAKVRIGKRKEQSLNDIKNKTVVMFDEILKMMEMSEVLLENNDRNLALDIIEEDLYLDQLQKDLVIDINLLIVLEQPKAGDLRLVMGTFGLSSDLERIGDYCKNFAKMMLKTEIDQRKHQKLVASLFKELRQRIEETKEAYEKLDHNMSKLIARRDRDIDNLSAKLVADVNILLMDVEDQDEIKSLTRVLMLAKTLERAGDHLVNVCEQISFIEKGQIYHYS